MPDIIHLLPDSVANQIAAGEVIQRPASAIKELIENAIDADATNIKLIVKEAGKTLIQVIDNGKGMSETDARMSFERHATSKIKTSDDLFKLTTKGFRGEALASIAAIAQVEIKTRTPDKETGTQIVIEGSELVLQEACSCPVGTSFSIKNLFYNVPARRNFLKSNNIETTHIIQEFLRVAIAHPDIAFSFTHNNNDVYHLEKGNLKQRLVAIFGNNYNQRLVPIEEDTTIVKLHGFIGKPEFARKTRGEQYFFINNRYIKNNYLHHAVQKAFDQLLPSDSFPSYFIFMEMNPASIDINIHPTKTEVKFEDEKSVYAILRSAIKQALGKNNIAPTIDFELEASLDFLVKPSNRIIEAPTITVDTNYNPFKKDSENNSNYSYKLKPNQHTISDWEKMVENNLADNSKNEQIEYHQDAEQEEKQVFQLHNKYIVTPIKSGFLIIDQQNAHERVQYEKLTQLIQHNKQLSQQLLFPQTIDFSPENMAVLLEIMPEIKQLGFDISEFGKYTFIIHGIPQQATENNIQNILEDLVEQYKLNKSEIKLSATDILVRSMAKSISIKSGKKLSTQEMQHLADELFACQMPYSAPSGKPTITTFSSEELDKRFKK